MLTIQCFYLEENKEKLEIATYTAVNIAVQYYLGNDLVNEKNLNNSMKEQRSHWMSALEECNFSKYLDIINGDSLVWTH